MARMKFSELAKQTMKPESISRARSAARAEIALMELAELRESFKITQADVAVRLKMSQAAISKLEKVDRNVHVNQLRALVGAMGGDLQIHAVFPGKTVQLNHIGSNTRSVAKTRKHKQAAHA